MPSPRCSRWRWAWPGSGSRGASNRTWCSATASANIRRPASRACSASRTEPLLIAERGRLFGSLPAGGRMAAAFADADRVESCTDEFPRLVGGRLQRRQHRAVRSGRGSGAGGGRADGRRRAMRMAGHQPCLPLRAARSGPRRVRVVCEPVSSSARRSGHWCATAPARPSAGRRNSTADYWRRHARQPVEFAKSVRTLAELGCAVLLEVGPQPVLTAAALRAWPDTERRAARQSRRCAAAVADHVRSAKPSRRPTSPATAPTSRALAQDGPQGRPAHLPVPASPVLVFDRARRSGPARCRAHRDRPAARGGPRRGTRRAVGAATGDDQTVGVLKQLAAQHNQQRSSQTIADARYETRLGEVGCTAASASNRSRVPPGFSSPMMPKPLRHWSTLLTARGHRHRILGMPVSDADEEQLEAALRAAAAEEPDAAHPASRGPRPGRRDVGALAGPDAAPSPRAEHSGSSVPRLAAELDAHHLAGHPWRTTGNAGRHRLTRAVQPVGFGRTASYEHPRLWGGLADLAAGGADDWSGLIAHIRWQHRRAKTRSRFGMSAVYVRPAVAARRASRRAAPLELRGDATYLVTGGLGASDWRLPSIWPRTVPVISC